MPGQKRKLTSLVPESVDYKIKKRNVKPSLPAQVKPDTCVEGDVCVNPERSPYFNTDGDDCRLKEEFFNQSCVCLAKALLGKVLVRRCPDGAELRGRVVETEAYLGGEDKASHSAGGKRTERNTAMFMRPGTMYVYPIYGIYLCMNISSQGEGAAVLLRAVEPLQGLRRMRQHRAARRREGARPLQDRELGNGPSKLCQALDVPRSFDRRDLASDPEVWLEADPQAGLQDVVTTSRIGIESHGEWAAKPLRFYLRGHPCVSVLDKQAERRLNPPCGSTVETDSVSSVTKCDVDTGPNQTENT